MSKMKDHILLQDELKEKDTMEYAESTLSEAQNCPSQDKPMSFYLEDVYEQKERENAISEARYESARESYYE